MSQPIGEEFIRAGNNFYDSSHFEVRHAALSGFTNDRELLTTKLDTSSAIVQNYTNTVITISGPITFTTDAVLGNRGVILVKGDAIATVFVNGYVTGENHLAPEIRELNTITYDTVQSGDYIKSRITTNRYTKTVANDSLDRIHYVQMVPTIYSHLVINTTTVLAPTPTHLTLIDVRAVSLNGVGSGKAFLMLTWTSNLDRDMTVKTKDDKDLKVHLSGILPDNTNVYGINVSINVTGYDLIGEVDSIVNSKNIVTSSDIVELRTALNTILSNQSVLDELYKSSKSINLTNASSLEPMDIEDTVRRILNGEINDETIMSIFTILCNFGDKIGLPFVKTFSNVMTQIYNSLRGKEITFSSTKQNGGTINAYQAYNSAFIKSSMSESSLISKIMSKIKRSRSNINHNGSKLTNNIESVLTYNQDDFENDLAEILNIMNSGNGSYCTATLFMSSAFGIPELASALGANFSEAVSQMKKFLSLYPVHVHVVVDEINPDNPTAPHRVLRVDVGMNWAKGYQFNGIFNLIGNNFAFESYMSDNKPPLVAEREKTFKAEFVLWVKHTIVDFDMCVTLAEIAKQVLPAYSIQNTCQQQSVIYLEAITEDVKGLLSMVD